MRERAAGKEMVAVQEAPLKRKKDAAEEYHLLTSS